MGSDNNAPPPSTPVPPMSPGSVFMSRASLVTFKVHAETMYGSEVYVVGSIESLGLWKPQNGLRLSTTPETYPMWTGEVCLPLDDETIEYKYVVMRGKAVRCWEQFRGNRSIKPDAPTLEVYDGVFGDRSTHMISSDVMWLNSRQQLRVRLGSNAFLHLSDEHIVYDVNLVGNTGDQAETEVGVLDNEVIVTSDSLSAISLRLDLMAASAVVPEMNPTGAPPPHAPKSRHVGTVFMPPALFRQPEGNLTLAVVSSSFELVGHIDASFLVLCPFVHGANDMSSNQPLERSFESRIIGHRGIGAKESGPMVGENTLLSFEMAIQKGTRFVEFDVQLTSDGVPVIYHDWDIPVKKLDGKRDIKVSLSRLSLKQFRQLSSHNTENWEQYEQLLGQLKPGEKSQQSSSKKLKRANSFTHLPSAEQKPAYKIGIREPFATLQECLERLPMELGFNVELKYPDKPQVREQFGAIERNAWLDAVLRVLFEYSDERTIFLSSFDPDMCLMAAKKQVRYPVFFLTDAGTLPHPDVRCASMDEAIRFASNTMLHGIVSESRPVLEDPSYVARCHEVGLMLMTFGAANNDAANVAAQRRMGVDAIITDKICFPLPYDSPDESGSVR